MTSNFMMALGCNLPAVLLLISVWTGNRLQFSKKTKKRYAMLAMIGVAFCSCMIDTVFFLWDGRAGAGYHILTYAAKTWLLGGHSVVALAWIMFLQEHLGVWKEKKCRRLLSIAPILGWVLLVINLFVPIVFYIDETEHYRRGPLLVYYYLFLIVYVLLGIVMVRSRRANRGVLPFFPIWSFVVPMLIGTVIQYFFYGLCLKWSCVAIAVTGILISLQNDNVYKDRLTGLYNRYYLDAYNMISRRNQKKIMGIMLDLNQFKQINDVYGHSVGDEALVHTAGILRTAVSYNTVVIRYAGDEFIVLKESDDTQIIEEYKASIQKSFDRFNQTKAVPYQLSVSMGSFTYDPETMTMEEFIDHIDQDMYENKKKFYEKSCHNRRNRKTDTR